MISSWQDFFKWVLDIFAYSASINACAKGEQWVEVLELLAHMRCSCVWPNVITWYASITVCLISMVEWCHHGWWSTLPPPNQPLHDRGSSLIFFFMNGSHQHFFLSFACQSLVLEVYILIFRAPCAGWAPDSWLSQKSKIATDKASNFYIFLENTFGGLPGLVGISRTKLKPKDPGIHLSRSQRLVLARKHQTIAKTKENKWGKTRIFYYYWGGCSSTMEVWLIGLRSTDGGLNRLKDARWLGHLHGSWAPANHSSLLRYQHSTARSSDNGGFPAKPEPRKWRCNCKSLHICRHCLHDNPRPLLGSCGRQRNQAWELLDLLVNATSSTECCCCSCSCNT